MNPKWRRFAPFGLYLAGIAALAAIGLYIVQREWNLALQICLTLVVVGLAVFIILDPERVRAALTGRRARHGSNALLLTVAFIGIVVVINYLVYGNSKRWDLTENKEFTLSPETISTLESLPEDVRARAFFSASLPSDQAKSLLDQYKFHSDGKFDFEFIDPIAEPLAANEAKITRDGTVQLIMGSNQRLVESVSEQELTGGLIKLINPDTRTVYFLTGHGEISPDQGAEKSYSQVKRLLESKNYTVNTLNLLADNKIPEDASAIVVAGPQKPVSQAEVDLLSQFVSQGGGLIVMQEPVPLTQFGETEDPLASYLASAWGINYGNDVVVDLSSNEVAVAIGSQYASHPITNKLQGMATIFPTTRSVTAGQDPSGSNTLTQLVLTSQNSWGETDLAGLETAGGQVKFDQGSDIQGPVPVVVTGENFSSQARVAAFGDADFPSDQFFQAYANADLFVNSVDWSVGNEELISLTPKENISRVVIPPGKVAMNLIMLGTVILIPLLVLAAGVVVWVQRRRRG